MGKWVILLALATTISSFDPWDKDPYHHHHPGWGWGRPAPPGWGPALGGVKHHHVSSSAAAASAAAGAGGVSVSSGVSHHQGHSIKTHSPPHDPYFPGYYGGIVSYPSYVPKKKGSLMDAIKDYFHAGYPGSFGWRGWNGWHH